MYSLLRPLLFRLSPEQSHDLTLAALRQGLGHLWPGRVPARPVRVMGLDFPNPVGLAAGLDKNGDCIDGLAPLGFGFVEVGTVTPRPQPGNPSPRLFRLAPAGALINRMGFNNRGVDYLVRAVEASRFDGIIGVNIGKNRDTPVERAVEDYLACMDRVHQVASYTVVNISSPNTPGLRELQHGDALSRLLEALRERQTMLDQRSGRRVPLVIKIAPDNDAVALEAMAAAFRRHDIDGVIVGNTTLSREGLEGLAHAHEQGGLSGRPLKPLADLALTQMAAALEGAIPLIGVGGIETAGDAADKRTAGASLVQVYTGLIYRGPGLVRELVRSWPQEQ